MDDIDKLASDTLADFRKLTPSAIPDDITADIWLKPHKPKGLPPGKMAVYAFFLNGQALKIGKAGPKSDARYRSHHYSPNRAGSTLAGSILKSPGKAGATGVNELIIGDWIKQHTDRVNFLLPASLGKHRLSLLETFLYDRWTPVFEGRGDDD